VLWIARKRGEPKGVVQPQLRTKEPEVVEELNSCGVGHLFVLPLEGHPTWFSESLVHPSGPCNIPISKIVDEFAGARCLENELDHASAREPPLGFARFRGKRKRSFSLCRNI
jgi:hypothetical protein